MIGIIEGETLIYSDAVYDILDKITNVFVDLNPTTGTNCASSELATLFRMLEKYELSSGAIIFTYVEALMPYLVQTEGFIESSAISFFHSFLDSDLLADINEEHTDIQFEILLAINSNPRSFVTQFYNMMSFEDKQKGGISLEEDVYKNYRFRNLHLDV